MEENPCFLSIIVPVYNGERYLEECLNSLLDQDLPEHTYELVGVNDGSKDGSAEILSRYQTCHQNLRVLFQQNSGVAAARNAVPPPGVPPNVFRNNHQFLSEFDVNVIIARTSSTLE